MRTDSDSQLRCGIVLAAGDGKRLHPFVRRLRGYSLPKQFVNFVGTRSMLEHTFSRAEMLLPPERLFTVVSQDHLGRPEVRRQLAGRPGGTVVVQPENRETGPGLLLPLMHLYKRYPGSTVVVFPSDHFIMEESLFMTHVDLAFRAVERYPSYMVLLGMEPDEPEPEYGYILPGREATYLAPLAIHEVSRFIEKPDVHLARELIHQGALWNTLVMVFKVRTLLELVRQAAPSLYSSFKRIEDVIGAPLMERVVEEIYRHMKPVNLSRTLLEPLSQNVSQLLVLPVRGVLWSDWGSQQRIISVLKKARFLEQPYGLAESNPMRMSGIQSRDAIGK